MANTIEYIFSLQDRISNRLSAVTSAFDRATDRAGSLGNSVRGLGSALDQAGRHAGGLGDSIEALTRQVDSLESAGSGGKFKAWAKDAFSAIPGANLITNPLVAASAALGFAGKSAMNYDENLAKVNITAQLDGSAYDKLKGKLKKIAVDNKTNIQVAPVGFEKINSQLNDVDLSLSILDASLKGSKAGFTDLDTVSGALAQTLSIVGKENASAAEVLDTFFAAKRVGAGEFADFARYMPNLIAGASNLGVNFKEVAGTFAYMTGKGQSAEKAAVLMENAFSVLGRADVRGKMEKAGVRVFDDQGKIRSVVDIFRDLEGVMGSLNNEQKSTLLEKLGLVDKEAKNAFAIMISDIGKLQSSMNEVSNASGETNKALGFSQNSVQKCAEVWDTFNNIGLELGEIILPVICAGLEVLNIVFSALYIILNKVNSLFSWWKEKLKEGDPIIWGITAAVGALSVALAINYTRTKSAIIISKLKLFTDKVLTNSTKALTAVQWALNAAFLASPLGWIVLAIGAVVTAVVYCWNNFEGFRKVVLGTWEVIKEFGRSLFDSIVTPFKKILSGLSHVGAALSALIKRDFKGAAAEAKAGFKEIGEGFIEGNPISVMINTGKKMNIDGAWKKGQQAGAESWADSKKKTETEKGTEEKTEEDTGKSVTTDFKDLLGKFSKNPAGKGKKTVLNLNDDIVNYNKSSDYLAATNKLSASQVSFSPSGKSLSPAASKIEGVTGKAEGGTGKKDEEYEAEKTNYLSDILFNVRKIAAVATIPIAIGASSATLTDSSNIGGYDRENTLSGAYNPSRSSGGKTVQVGKVCEQLVFHVQNTDGKGLDTIRNEVINVLNEVCSYES